MDSEASISCDAGEFMWMKDFVKGWALSLALFIALVPVGCGKGDVQSTNITGNVTPGFTGGTCPAGQVAVNGYPCFSAGDAAAFYNNCLYNGNFVSIGGVQVCKADIVLATSALPYVYSIAVSYNRPQLGPGNPNGFFNVINTGIPLKKNDRLNVSASGNWGHDQKNFYWGDWNCDNAVDVTDSSRGLYASEGTEIFFAGSNLVRTINNNGYLLFGFNAGSTTIGCSKLVIPNIRITRCQDQVGNTYPCP